MAEFESEIAGFAMADPDEGSVFAMFVYPELEGNGLGKALLKTAENFLFQDFNQIWLETDKNSRAFGFYQYSGWNVIENLEHNDVKMEKNKV